jgi:archaellum biogenesis protein FlaJ (TadC family)
VKDAEIDYISAYKDAYVSLLITFVFIKVMKILCKVLENLFRALTIAKV